MSGVGFQYENTENNILFFVFAVLSLSIAPPVWVSKMVVGYQVFVFVLP